MRARCQAPPQKARRPSSVASGLDPQLRDLDVGRLQLDLVHALEVGPELESHTAVRGDVLLDVETVHVHLVSAVRADGEPHALAALVLEPRDAAHGLTVAHDDPRDSGGLRLWGLA